MNLPNKLTLLRFLLVPVFMVFMYNDNPYSYLKGLVVFAGATSGRPHKNKLQEQNTMAKNRIPLLNRRGRRLDAP